MVASTVLQNFPRTMSAPPKMDEQVKAAKLNEVSAVENNSDSPKVVPGLPSKAPKVPGPSNFDGSEVPVHPMGMPFVPANPYVIFLGLNFSIIHI